MVLAALKYVGREITIASVASDGWDNTEHAGAIGDSRTLERARESGIDPNESLKTNNSLDFFKQTSDAIITGRLPSNVSDLIVVLRK